MLPFDAETLFALQAQVFREHGWLAALAALLALLLLLLSVPGPMTARLRFQPRNWYDRSVAFLLALAWLWIALGYFLAVLGPLFFAAPLLALLFGVQAVLLVWQGLFRGGLALRFRPDLRGWAGMGLALFALAGPALLHGLAAREAYLGWQGVPLLGLAPTPLALFTLALLLLGAQGRQSAAILAVVPVLWCLLAGVQAWALEMPQDLPAPVLALAAFVLLLVFPGRRPGAEP